MITLWLLTGLTAEAVEEPEQQEQPKRSAGGGRGRRTIPVIDVIWPDDPRHPTFVDRTPPPTPQIHVAKAPKPAPIRVPGSMRPTAPVEVVRPRYDDEIALLLLAA
jgi:hypothetical protein